MLTMPHWPKPLFLPVIMPGLERIQALLDVLGNPERHLPPVIHVAGTNGKGSTVAFLRAVCEAAGLLVHCYTSPHLVRFNERIRLSGQEISDEYCHEILEECRIACEANSLQVTFFEGTTAGAFLAFSRVPADIVILETGMGGKFDATNVISKPVASVITPISLDHTDFLGTTLAAIAGEKAGIMKPGSPCVISLQSEEAEATLLACAEALHIPTAAYGYEWGIRKEESCWHFQSESLNLALPFPALIGDHQLVNAATAIATILVLPKSLQITADAIRQGMQSASWPGRLQKLVDGHVTEQAPTGVECWLDGAHNPDGTAALARWLEEQPPLPLTVIMGVTKGRDCQALLAPLVPWISTLVGVRVESEPSSLPAEAIVAAGEALGLTCLTADSVDNALSLAMAAHQPSRILACGSLYLVGDILVRHHGYNAVA
jgi:dihydrofolate synthase/folylpolyglutamate synthase